MSSPALIAYAAALLVAVATPGPAALAVISTGITSGVRRANLLALGIATGDVMLGAIALTGLVVLAVSFGWIFEVLRYACAGCLVWLGVRMWRSPAKESASEPGSALAPLAAGLAIALSNPKAILFHASLMPLIVDIAALTRAEVAALLGIVAAINLAVMSAYASFASNASRRFQRPARMRWLNRAGGGAMVATAALIAAP